MIRRKAIIVRSGSPVTLDTLAAPVLGEDRRSSRRLFVTRVLPATVATWACIIAWWTL